MALKSTSLNPDQILKITEIDFKPSNRFPDEAVEIFKTFEGKEIKLCDLEKVLNPKINEINKIPTVISSKAQIKLPKKNETSIGEAIPIRIELIGNFEPRFNLKLNTDLTSDSDVIAGTQFEVNNFFRKGEVFSASAEKSIKGQTIFDLSAAVLNKRFVPVFLRGTLFKHTNDMTAYTSAVENSNGLQVSIKSEDGRNTITYNYNERTNKPSRLYNCPEGYDGPSQKIIEDSILSSTKSSISYDHFLIKNLDNYLSPSKGIFLSNFYELAGIGKGIKFIKIHSTFGYYWPIPNLNGFSLSYEGFWGYNHSFKSFFRPKEFGKSLINDRFFLGGMNSVPGYDLNTIGKKSSYDAVGGDIVLNNKLSLKFPLPIQSLREAGLNGFVMASFGSVSTVSNVQNNFKGLFIEGVKTFLREQFYSVSAGIEWPLPQVNGSLRVCLVKTFSQRKAVCKQRVRFGVKAGVM